MSCATCVLQARPGEKNALHGDCFFYGTVPVNRLAVQCSSEGTLLVEVVWQRDKPLNL